MSRCPFPNINPDLKGGSFESLQSSCFVREREHHLPSRRHKTKGNVLASPPLGSNATWSKANASATCWNREIPSSANPATSSGRPGAEQPNSQSRVRGPRPTDKSIRPCGDRDSGHRGVTPDVKKNTGSGFLGDRSTNLGAEAAQNSFIRSESAASCRPLGSFISGLRLGGFDIVRTHQLGKFRCIQFRPDIAPIIWTKVLTSHDMTAFALYRNTQLAASQSLAVHDISEESQSCVASSRESLSLSRRHGRKKLLELVHAGDLTPYGL